MNTSATKTKALCVATRCTSVDQFVATFHRFCGDDQTFFVATMTSRPIGLETPFSIQLADKQPVLRGLCVVLDAWQTPDNRFKRPGIRLGIKRLTEESQIVFDRLKAAARAPAAVADATPWPGLPPVTLPVGSLLGTAVDASPGSSPAPAARGSSPTAAARAQPSRPPSFPLRSSMTPPAFPAVLPPRAALPPLRATPPRPSEPPAKPSPLARAAEAAVWPPPPPAPSQLPATEAVIKFRPPTARPVTQGSDAEPTTAEPTPPAPVQVTRFQVALHVDTAAPPVNDAEWKPTQLVPRLRPEPRITSDPPPRDEPAIDPRDPALIIDRPSDPDLSGTRPTIPSLAALAAAAPVAAPVASEIRTPGSSFVLPANPLQNLSDESLEGFVDCTLYEEAVNVFHPGTDGDGGSDFAPGTVPAMPFDAAPELTVRSVGETESLLVAPDVPAFDPFREPAASGPYPPPPYPPPPYSQGPYPQGPAGPYPSGPYPSGPYPSQPYPSGPYPSGPNPSQPYPSGPYPSGPNPSQPYPSGPYPPGPNPPQPYPSGPNPSQRAFGDQPYRSTDRRSVGLSAYRALLARATARLSVEWRRWLLICGTAVAAIVVAFLLARLARGPIAAEPATGSSDSDVALPAPARPPAARPGGASDARAASADDPASADGSGDPAELAGADDPAIGAIQMTGSGPCQLIVATTPAGSIVRLDEQPVGASPITIKTSCDKHKVDVAHARYQGVTRWVTPTADKPEPLEISLSRPIHAVTVTSVPPGAELSIDGRRAGTTPTVVQVMGFASVNLTFTKPGFQSVTRRVYSKLAQDRVSVKLSR